MQDVCMHYQRRRVGSWLCRICSMQGAQWAECPSGVWKQQFASFRVALEVLEVGVRLGFR